MAKSSASDRADLVAQVVHRVAVLVGAGVPLDRTWGYLDDATAQRVVAGVARGRSVTDVLTNESDVSWRLVAATIDLARSRGAPIARVLAELADRVAREGAP